MNEVETSKMKQDKIVIQFRGAGQNPIPTLKQYIQYPLLLEFILDLERFLNNQLENSVLITSRCNPQFDIINWINNDHDIMNEAYYWQPLIFISQAVAYYDYCIKAESYPIWNGCIGHSIGMTMAVVASLSSNRVEYMSNCKVAVLYMAYQGFWMNHVIGSQKDDSNMLLVKGTQNKPPKNLELALINSFDQYVYSGSSYDVQKVLQNSTTLKNQDKILYSQRSENTQFVDLKINIAGHNKYMNANIAEYILEHMHGFDFTGTFRTPVYSSFNGSLLVHQNIVLQLAELQCYKLVNWPTVLHNALKTANCVIDFGPGKQDGLYNITLSQLDQQQIYSVNCPTDMHNLTKHESHKYTGVSKINNKIITKFTQLGYASPYLCAGMTPTSTCVEFVASAVAKGHYAELAGGGYFQRDVFAQAIKDVTKLGKGNLFGINIIYANPRLWSWQFSLAIEMRLAGYPIDGVTIGAGVPTKEAASDIVTEMIKAGMRYVAFKPSSRDTIKRVMDIAKLNPQIAVILQWTSGQAGGHHSYEDFGDPILTLYNHIRKIPNIILVAGSGMGNGVQSLPYLTGTWSESLYNRTMPFDGILFGSAIMTCKESRLTSKAKDILVQTKGTSNWEACMDIASNTDIISIRSELGEQIHVVATQGAKTWQWFDHNIFIDNPKAYDVSEIIERINNTYQKPYFGDIEIMTRKQVLERFLEFVHIHPHYQQKFDKLFKMFANKSPSGWLTQSEVDQFILICRQTGEKTVPFIPTINESFEFWFKKDSLWYCENDLFDADKTIILQGPLSVKFITHKDIPLGDFLDSCLDSIKDMVPQDKHSFPKFIPTSRDYNILKPLALDHDPSLSHFEFNFQGVTCTVHKHMSTDYTSLFMNLLKNNHEIRIDKHSTRQFVYNTGIHSSNAWFGLICARSVTIGFYYLLNQIKFNPCGVIHLSQYFERIDATDYYDMSVKMQPEIISTVSNGTRSTVVLKTVFYVNETVIGHTISTFSVLGYLEDTNHTHLQSTISVDMIDETNTTTITKNVPVTGWMYAKLSGDYNPIHFLQEFAQLAHLDSGCLVHGMWTLAATLTMSHVKSGLFHFKNPLEYGNYIDVDIKSLGWTRGDTVQSIHVKQGDSFIMDGKVTFYKQKAIVFSGQGSISPKDGLQLCHDHKVIRDIYQRCDKILFHEFGISILNVLEHNPKTITLYLTKDQQQYWEKSQLTLSHDNGLIHFTPINQVITLLYHYAVYMVHDSMYNAHDIFAGHSLGEYIIPLLLLNIPIEKVLQLTFIRGLFMYKTVLDEHQYRMISVNPARINKTFNQLKECVNHTFNLGEFVEIVNYNVLNKQYVVAGTIEGLQQMIRLFEENPSINPGKTRSSIMLHGITVPFHSVKMKASAIEFKRIIQKTMLETYDYHCIVHHYIPNLTGVLFDCSLEYLEIMRPYCDDSIINNIRDSWNTLSLNSRCRLMFIELLSMQFCSNVQWIKTTDTISDIVDTVYEIGPKPILTKMIQQHSKPLNMFHQNETSTIKYTSIKA